MANKSKKKAAPKAAKPENDVAHVTRISATDKKPAEVKADKKVKAVKAPKVTKEKKESKGRFKAFRAIGGYFKGAWYELRQVRWPNRRATWSLTAAVLIFTTFFVLLVVLLDILFKYLFQLILG